MLEGLPDATVGAGRDGRIVSVVAEGVENESQATLLAELACPLAQGFFFGPPA